LPLVMFWGNVLRILGALLRSFFIEAIISYASSLMSVQDVHADQAFLLT